MSTQYPGGFITKSPVAPTTTAASGIWTVDQALQYVKAGTWPAPPVFIEDLFSTYLYTGTAATLNITNGINLSGDGGLVWSKRRNTTGDNVLVDTVRGMTNTSAGIIFSNATDAQNTAANFMNASTTGYTLGAANGASTNASGGTYVSWTFKEQPKFFDIVTYTGNDTAGRTIAHNLGSVPGCIMVKATNSPLNWFVYHTSLGNTKSIYLNLTSAATTVGNWGNTTPTSTVFTVDGGSETNQAGVTYVAYLFANDAGGFPASGAGSTNGISCGSYTGTGATTNNITLGYEPQWLLIKRTSGLASWYVIDIMRGANNAGLSYLFPNLSDAEGGTTTFQVTPTATGFSIINGTSAALNGSGDTYIYIAIRRGPMKTPTVGTSVFGINARTGTGVDVTVTGGTLPDDVAVIKARSTGQGALWAARLTGTGYALSSEASAIAAAGTTILQANPWDVMDGIKVGTTSSITNASGATYINYLLSRAPGFMDVVCYTGIDPSIEHNLGVTPEMYIVKSRSSSSLPGSRWSVYHTGYATATNFIALNSTNGITAGTIWGSGPTASLIGATGGTPVNDVDQTYIAYLFATLAGISKVGSYTGTGALQTVNCGFTAGARFVLIKRTDTTGDWYTYDTARGMSSGTDPYFWMNTSAAEDATTNYVDTDTTGFKVTAAAPAGLNAVGGNYIFLAIA